MVLHHLIAASKPHLAILQAVALMHLLFFGFVQSVSAATIILSEAATGTYNGSDTTFTAFAEVIADLPYIDDPTLNFASSEVIVEPGQSAPVTYTVSNTGRNALNAIQLNLLPPVGVDIDVPDSPFYTSVSQPDGSILITFNESLQSTHIVDVLFDVMIPEDSNSDGGILQATFNAVGDLSGNPITAVQTMMVKIEREDVSLFLSNTASKTNVGADEPVFFNLNVTNTHAKRDAQNVFISDRLPLGVRFMQGTAKRDGQSIADPVLTADGRSLAFYVGDLKAEETRKIEYMAYVSSLAPQGELKSPSIARSAGIHSNAAEVLLYMRRDPINVDSHVVGRVMAGACEIEKEQSHETQSRLSSELDGDAVVYTLSFNANKLSLDKAIAKFVLPQALVYQKDSAILNGEKTSNPGNNSGHLKFKLPSDGAEHILRFRAQLRQPDYYGLYETSAQISFQTKDYGKHETAVLLNSFKAEKKETQTLRLSHRSLFDETSSIIAVDDLAGIDYLLKEITDADIQRIYILASSSIHETNGDDLAWDRANNVALYVNNKLNLTPGKLSLDAKTHEPDAGEKNINFRSVDLIVELKEDGVINQKYIVLGDASEQSTPFKIPYYKAPTHSLASVPGVAGVRLYTEEGRFVETDKFGRFHFEALKPGTHVLQLDPDSIPEGYEAYLCESNNRFAGNPSSRFVDIKKGLIWRANFHLRPTVDDQTTAHMQMFSSLNGSQLDYQLKVSAHPLKGKDLSLTVDLPAGIEADTSSFFINGQSVKATKDQKSYNVDLNAIDLSTFKLHFKAELKTQEIGDYISQASLDIKKPNQRLNERVQTVKNIISILPENMRAERYVLPTHFIVGDDRLRKSDQYALDDIVKLLGNKQVQSVEVLAYSNSAAESSQGQADALALKRARKVSNYLLQNANLDDALILVKGKGSDFNSRINEQNRVEVLVYTTDAPKAKVTKAESVKAATQVKINEKENTITLQQSADEADHIDAEGIISIAEGDAIIDRINAVRINLDSRLTPVLKINGVAVANDRIGFTRVDPTNGKTLYVYFGLDLGDPGNHAMHLQGLGPFGNARFEQELRYNRSEGIRKIQFVASADNIADGSSPIEATIKLFDNNGVEVHGEFDLKITSGDLIPLRRFTEDDMPYVTDELGMLKVNKQGLVRFDPVSQPGLYRVIVKYKNVVEELKVKVRPHYREWIMVGLAEAQIGLNDVKGNTEGLSVNDIEEDFYNEERLAFYAKGKILGKYLLTAAYDSDKKTKEEERFLQLINPEDYYTLYGDTSEQRFDAASREKLYLRLDADEYYAMFGDYNTGLNVTRLSRYSRAFTGAKAELENERFSVTAFAAESSQVFKRDEILGDGTSGLYHLSQERIIANSEKIIIQVRDRFHSERIVSEQSLTRYADYQIDYQDGSIYFKQPIPRYDPQLNPVYIVADYESYSTSSGDIVAGGRAAVKFNDEKIEVGVSHINDGTEGAKAQLSGIDINVKITDDLTLHAEVATSKLDGSSQSASDSGSAYSAELRHISAKAETHAYIIEQEQGFGIGMQNQSENGKRKVGVKTDVLVAENMTIDADISQEGNLYSDAMRRAIEGGYHYRPATWDMFIGAAIVEDTDAFNKKHQSELLRTGLQKELYNNRLRLRALSEWALSNDDVIDYPTRHTFGADYAITSAIDAFAEYEVTDGSAVNSSTVRTGLRSRPWENGVVNTSVVKEDHEFSDRTFAVFGLIQTVPINQQWRMSFSYDQTKTLERNFYPRVNPDTTIASGTTNTVLSTNGAIDEDFWASTVGASYKSGLYLFDSRVEYRSAATNDKYGIFTSWQRNLNQGVAHALRFLMFNTDYVFANNEIDSQLRYSSVIRPIGGHWFIFNRTELKFLDNGLLQQGTQEKKFVEHIAINYMPSADWQYATHLGYKYTVTETERYEFKNNTFILGNELRHDINEHWDVGGHYHLLTALDLGLQEYSYGLSAGVDVARNMWLSLGYNFDGFEDDDFDANGYTAQGPFLKLRFKFDQNTFNLRD
ncbi:MAG: OmpA family protein [Pseudomonadales bacterium]|nr:OmpA family protein [Pseudomonadales bacterium]